MKGLDRIGEGGRINKGIIEASYANINLFDILLCAYPISHLLSVSFLSPLSRGKAQVTRGGGGEEKLSYYNIQAHNFSTSLCRNKSHSHLTLETHYRLVQVSS